MGQDNVLYDILERENAILVCKNTGSNGRKDDILPFPKMANFLPFFFLRNIGQVNVFYDIIERKPPF